MVKKFLGLLDVAFAYSFLASEIAQTAQVYAGTLGGGIGFFGD